MSLTDWTLQIFLHPHLAFSCPFPSTRQDDFFILQEEAADSFLESIFKTEFVSLLCKRFEEAAHKPLPLTFSDTYAPPLTTNSRPKLSIPYLPQGPRHGLGVEEEPQMAPSRSLLSPRLQFRVKKEGWGGGSTRNVTFSRGTSDLAVLKAGGRTLTISIGDGLPKSTSKSLGTRGGHRRARPVGEWLIETNQLCGGGAS